MTSSGPGGEVSSPPDPTGSVVLDIGGSVGALVVYVDADLTGCELPVSRAGQTQHVCHTGVHPRLTPAGTSLLAAVFPALEQGRYQLWHPSGAAGPVAQVVGGRVSEIHWASAADPGPTGPADQRSASVQHPHTHAGHQAGGHVHV